MPPELFDLWHGALTLMISVGGPFVATALGVGLMASILQAATQLQENVISFAPKLVSMGALLAFGGTWLLTQLVRYFESIGIAIEQLGHR